MPIETGTKRVLVYRLGSLGDTVVSLPSLHLIARTYPNAERALLTNVPVNGRAAAASAVLGHSGLIHRYLSYPVGTRGVSELATLWRRILLFRPEVLVYLMPIRAKRAVYRDLAFFRLCAVKRIVGAPWGDRAIHRCDAVTGLFEAEAARLARCIEEIGDAEVNEPASWDLRLSDDERATARALLGASGGNRYICCGVGTKQDAKDWGVDNWRQLLAQMTERFAGYPLVLVGAGDEREASEEASRVWPGPCVNVCGRATPRETAAILADAELFLGPDSGPMHLAAAVGTPVVSVFSGQSRPGIWHPFGNRRGVVFHQTDCCGCKLETCTVEKKKCILSITPDEVLRTALAVAGSRN